MRALFSRPRFSRGKRLQLVSTFPEARGGSYRQKKFEKGGIAVKRKNELALQMAEFAFFGLPGIFATYSSIRRSSIFRVARLSNTGILNGLGIFFLP